MSTTTAAVLSLGCTAGCIACLVYLHLAPTGYSPVRNAVSEYGVGRYAALYSTQAMLMGIAALWLAVALRQPHRVVVLLVLFALARISIGWFPTDQIGSRQRTSRGSVHLVLAAVAFVTLPWAAVDLTRSEGGEPWLGRILVVLAVLTAVALRTQLRPWFGLVERALYVGMLAWLIVVAVRLL
jgi:hypothetical membrane protein